MIDCSCYHDEINFFGKRGLCWGTKEREPCSCGGDASKCDFYPSVRKKEKKLITNADRIRSMSDEELAVILAKITEPNKLPMFHGLFMNGEKDVWLDWLREEAHDA